MHHKGKTLIATSVLLATLAGCGAATAPSSVPQVTRGEPDGAFGQSVVLVSDLRLGSCTGTVLSRRHVLTAAHCVQGGTGKPFVNVYGPTETLPRPEPIAVARIAIPEGIDSRRRDFISDEEVYADLAVLTLASDLPSGVRPVSLASRYPGQGREAVVAGTGEHDGRRNRGAELRSRGATLVGSSDAGGAIVVDGSYTNRGDSGGPLFDGRRAVQLGVLSGSVSYQGRTLDRYSSVSEPRNRRWIQGAMRR